MENAVTLAQWLYYCAWCGNPALVTEHEIIPVNFRRLALIKPQLVSSRSIKIFNLIDALAYIHIAALPQDITLEHGSIDRLIIDYIYGSNP